MCQLDIISGGHKVPSDRWEYILSSSGKFINILMYSEQCLKLFVYSNLVMSMFSPIVQCTDINSDQDLCFQFWYVLNIALFLFVRLNLVMIRICLTLKIAILMKKSEGACYSIPSGPHQWISLIGFSPTLKVWSQQKQFQTLINRKFPGEHAPSPKLMNTMISLADEITLEVLL